jgi:hypothetical protein
VPPALADLEERVKALFGKPGYVETERSGNAGTQATIRIQASDKHWPALRALLESRLRRPLLG